MCGRFALYSTAEEIARQFRLGNPPEHSPRYNIAPSQLVLAVAYGKDTRPTAGFMRWGLVPHWADDAKVGHQLINARAETLANKPAFRDSFQRRRCLIPANGFYEWRHDGDRKQPHYVTLKKKDGIMALAGLWDRWRRQDGQELLTCTIVTVPANSMVRRVHDRMPAIIEPEHYGFWLGPHTSTTTLKDILKPYSPYKVKLWPVVGMVNDPKNDAPGCIRKA
ncbi:SOS response-associated peptidase [Thermodesulfobacteriota bacterium]